MFEEDASLQCLLTHLTGCSNGLVRLDMSHWLLTFVHGNYISQEHILVPSFR